MYRDRLRESIVRKTNVVHYNTYSLSQVTQTKNTERNVWRLGSLIRLIKWFLWKGNLQAICKPRGVCISERNSHVCCNSHWFAFSFLQVDAIGELLFPCPGWTIGWATGWETGTRNGWVTGWVADWVTGWTIGSSCERVPEVSINVIVVIMACCCGCV